MTKDQRKSVIGHIKKQNIEFGIFSIDSITAFEKDEACGLLYHEVIRTENKDQLPDIPLEKVGLVSGVITLNDEIEVLVRYMGEIKQLTRREFLKDFMLVPNQ